MVHKHSKSIRSKYDYLKQAQKRILEKKVKDEEKDEEKDAKKTDKKFNCNKPAVFSRKASKKHV